MWKVKRKQSHDNICWKGLLTGKYQGFLAIQLKTLLNSKWWIGKWGQLPCGNNYVMRVAGRGKGAEKDGRPKTARHARSPSDWHWGGSTFKRMSANMTVSYAQDKSDSKKIQVTGKDTNYENCIKFESIRGIASKHCLLRSQIPSTGKGPVSDWSETREINMRVPSPWIVGLGVPSAIAAKHLIASICNLLTLPLSRSMNVLGWTCWKNCKKWEGHSSLQSPFPSMCSTSVHCKQHGSPQHSVLKRVSGMLRGNIRAHTTTISDITLHPPPRSHWHTCKYPSPNKQPTKQTG